MKNKKKQLDFAIKCFAKWLQIREQEYKKTKKHSLKFPDSAHKLYVDAIHSRLLKSLFYGEEPLPEIPPDDYRYKWQDNKDPKINEQIFFAAKCIKDWLTIKEQEGKTDTNSALRFKIDADHSSLLRRLFYGVKPLPKPPPKSYSYPWYELIDNGEDTSIEINWVSKDYNKPMLVIDQTPWEIIKKISNQHYIVYHELSDTKCDVKFSHYHEKTKKVKYWNVKVLDEERKAMHNVQ